MTQTLGHESATILDAEPRKIEPITIWACIGGVMLAFEIYVICKWITGPNFVAVGVGADQPPPWMKTFLIVWQVVGPLAMLFTFYWLLIRPWRRRRELTFDGLFCIGLFALSFWDANSAYFQNWFQYNPYLLNRGSLVHEIPGWMSFGAPGKQIAFPYLVMPPAYVYAFMGLMILGCWFMRTLRRRWPTMNSIALYASCVVFMMLCDLVMEGAGFIPLGVWTYPGAPGTLFGMGTRWRYPFAEMALTGLLFATLACVRYFKNDRGESFFEHGLSRLNIGRGKQTLLRIFAFVAAAPIIMFATYHIPMSMLVIQSPEWPQEVQDTSWLNGGLCGKGTGRACPGPRVPVPRPDSPHLDPAGRLVPAR